MSNIIVIMFILFNTTISGLYFTFSNTIMPVLKQEEDARIGIRIMNRINDVIQNSPFFLLFFGSPLLAVAMVLMNMNSILFWVGSLLHIIGSFLVTIVKNVPWNNRLMNEADETSWQEYVSEWTRWNTIRAIVGLLASTIILLELFY
ncbi:anthrone oxygenase family protein [Ruoffia tabacinasalis]|nr:anthrone oxygenase family protein [Ruoffia tabacinasalis]